MNVPACGVADEAVANGASADEPDQANGVAPAVRPYGLTAFRSFPERF
jgi:hypothetical protein